MKSVVFYVDRKTVRDAEEVATTYAKLTDSEFTYYEFDPTDTLAAREKEWLIQYRKPRGNKVNQQKLDKFADFIDQRLAIKVTFCSTIREDLCWPKGRVRLTCFTALPEGFMTDWRPSLQ